MITRYWEKKSTMEMVRIQRLGQYICFEYTSDSVYPWTPSSHSSWSAIENSMTSSGFVELPPSTFFGVNKSTNQSQPSIPFNTIRRWEHSMSGGWAEYKETKSGVFEHTNDQLPAGIWRGSGASNWMVVEWDMSARGYNEVTKLPVGQQQTLAYPLGTVRRWESGISTLDWVDFIERTTGDFETCDGTRTTHKGGWLASSFTTWAEIEKYMAQCGLTEVAPSFNSSPSFTFTPTMPAPKYKMSFIAGAGGNGGSGGISITIPDGMELIPMDFKTEESKPRHKCHCDLTGPNCWLGCRCGGI